MPVIVGWIIEALVWVFRSRIGLFITSALVWAGLTYGTQKVVVTPAINLLRDYMGAMSGGSGVAGAAWAWIGVLRFDIACTMIISAIVIKTGVGAAKVVLMKHA